MQQLPEAIFEQDNARHNTTRVSKDCFHTFTTFHRPAQSPDLSPIENICDHLGWRVGHHTSLNELDESLLQICNEMSQDIMQNVYASRPILSLHAFMLEGAQQRNKSLVFLPFSLK
ncbi:transposable element Tcb2 transposase [Trichonephila clavipes]|nr:transposable element Tcb2 transposase [Trichonephila clavipes]